MSEQNGAKIWIRLPGFSIQPAEFSKILLLIFFAAVLVAKRSLFTSAGKHFLGMDLPRPRDLAPLLAAWIASVGVMVFEKDLGTSLLLYASFLVLVYIATDRLSWVLLGLTLFAAGSVIAYYVFAHVRVRVENWLDPFADPDGTGYQMVQSLFSFATGGIFGTGLGNGQPGTVPAASTDFIIAADRRGTRPRRARGRADALHDPDHPRSAHRDRGARQLRQAAGRGAGLDAGDPVVHRRRRRHEADPPDRADHAVDVVRRVVADRQLRAAGDPHPHLALGAPPPDAKPPERHPDRGGQHGGDRTRMNTSLRRISVTIMALIVLLLANATLTQVFTADALRSDPRNQRVLLDEYSRQRGQISAGGQLLAYSASTNGHFRFLRVYPNPQAYAPVTGFYSLLYSSTGLERAEDSILNGSDERLFGRRLADFFTGRDPRGGNVATTINPQVQQAAWDAMQKGCNDGPCKGAVVALEPSTGKILAMVSSPSYDPNLLASHEGSVQSDSVAAAARRSERPARQPRHLRDLSPRLDVQGDHHRGCARNGATPDTQVTAASRIPLPDSTATLENYGGTRLRQRPDDDPAHRVREVVQHRVRRPRHQDRHRCAAQHGRGVRSGRRSPAASRFRWRQSTVGPISDAAALGMSSIGQKDVALTPLQNAMIAATVANGGVTMQPYLVDDLKGPDLANISSTSPTRTSDGRCPPRSPVHLRT